MQKGEEGREGKTRLERWAPDGFLYSASIEASHTSYSITCFDPLVVMAPSLIHMAVSTLQ
jgi:hypothetical protein